MNTSWIGSKEYLFPQWEMNKLDQYCVCDSGLLLSKIFLIGKTC